MAKHKIKCTIEHLGDEGCHLFCKARINGKKVRVLIDTGASKSVLSTEFADKLKSLKYISVGDNETSGIGPEKVEAQFARLKTLRFKSLNIKKLIVGTIDVSHVKALYKSLNIEPFDFILGGDVLEKYKAKVDYNKKTLTLG